MLWCLSATCATAWKRLHQFCKLVGTKVMTNTIMMAFVAYLARQHAASTVRLYVSAIRAIAKENGKDLSSRRVDLAVKGVARAQANRTKNASKPILRPHMAAMRNALIRSNLNATDRAMAWAAICPGFFACLRASEYTSTTATTMSDGGLRTNDLSITPQAIQVTIKKSKTDQLGKGHSVRLTTTNSTVCSVRAMHTYLSRRANLPNRPLVIESCGNFLAAQRLTRLIRQLLSSAGYPPNQYPLHGLRAGPATTGALSGFTESEIMKLGRTAKCLLQALCPLWKVTVHRPQARKRAQPHTRTRIHMHTHARAHPHVCTHACVRAPAL